LIKKRIDTVFMTVDGRFQARLLLDEAGHVALRQKSVYSTCRSGLFTKSSHRNRR
jgi:hypothetical protein